MEDFCEHGNYVCNVPTCGDSIAWDRHASESCERGTPGCSVRHGSDNTDCQPW